MNKLLILPIGAALILVMAGASFALTSYPKPACPDTLSIIRLKTLLELEALNNNFASPNIVLRRASVGNPLPPIFVGNSTDLKESSANPTFAPYVSALVKLTGPVRVARIGSPNGDTVLGTHGALVVSNAAPGDSVFIDCGKLTTILPPAVGTVLSSVTGIGNKASRGFRIMPRNAADIVDAQPPAVTDGYAIADNQYRIVFDRSVTTASATNSANYSLASLGIVNAAVMDGSSAVILTVSGTGLSHGDPETVTVNGVVGLVDGVAMTTPASVTFFFGVLTIAEIQAPDPGALAGAPCVDRSSFAGAGSTLGTRMTFHGVATAGFGNLNYLQDETGGPRSGIALFAPTVPLVTGHRYLVAGAVQEFVGETEVANEVFLRDDGVGSVPSAILDPVSVLRDTTCDDAQSLLTGEDLEGVLVRADSVRVAEDAPAGGSFHVAGRYGVFADTILVANGASSYTFDPSPGQLLRVTGVLTFRSGRFQLQPRNNADIILLGAVGVPSAANSTCPAKVTAAPDGNCCFDVIVRDVLNNPIAGSSVVVSFGSCPITFCPTQPAGVVVNVPASTARVFTDATGTAHMCICVSTQIASCTTSISADGVTLCTGLVASSCPSDSACTPGVWKNLGNNAPSARFGMAMASNYDQESIILFGGESSANYLADTWKWDGLGWHLVSISTPPSPRASHAMAYDRARKRVVMFGGLGVGGIKGDTWEFDGTNWLLVSVTGPPARYGHGLTYDENRGRIVLFGGYNGGFLADTWEWDGTTWTQTPTTTAPTPRQAFSMAYDYASGLTLLYGGSDASGPVGDTWVYSGTGWLQLSPTGATPGLRQQSAMAFSAEGNSLVLYGGNGPGTDASTWRWNGGTWAISVPGVGSLEDHAMAYDHFNDHLMLFGGRLPGAIDGKSDTWEWCSPCSMVAALLDTLDNVIVPDDADTSAWNSETDVETDPVSTGSLYPQFDTSLDNWYGNIPCDPSFGAEQDSTDLIDPWGEEADSLGTPDLTEAEVTDSLNSWEDQFSAMAKKESDPFPDSLGAVIPYTPPAHRHCLDRTKKYAFGGRDIVFVHGLRLIPLKDRMFGLNDSSLVDWVPPQGASGLSTNPTFYGDGHNTYWKGGAVNYWKQHIDHFLKDKGYANRYIIVAWPATQRMKYGMSAFLSQVADAMHDGTGVVDLSGHNDIQGFGSPSFVVVSHSTGAPVVDAALSVAEHDPGWNAGYIAAHAKAHIAIQGAFGGSKLATAAVGASVVLQSTSIYWVCKLLQYCLGSNGGLCDHVVNWDTPVRGVTWDLMPLVMQWKWGPKFDGVPGRTVTVTGGHPSFHWPIKRLLLRGLDDGVVNTNSAVANPNPMIMWPSGYLRLGPEKFAGKRVKDIGINEGILKRRSRGYAKDQLKDPLLRPRSLDPIFPPELEPYLTRVATGCTDGLSPTGMVQPWHIPSLGGPLDPNNRYIHHYSFIESAAEHYGMTPNVVGDVFPANQEYALSSTIFGDQHNAEEVRVITDDGIHQPYGGSGDPAPLIDKTSAAVSSGLTVEVTSKGKCFPKRKNKPCKVWRWHRTYNRLTGWKDNMAADYVYAYLLTQPADTCYLNPNVGVGPSRIPFFARNGRNPFSRELTIEFQLPERAKVDLEVYDMQGRRVRSLAAQSFEPGPHRVVWDGRSISGALMHPGMYLWRMRLNGEKRATEKALLLH